MNILELESLGVTEMTAIEKNQIEGGSTTPEVSNCPPILAPEIQIVSVGIVKLTTSSMSMRVRKFR